MIRESTEVYEKYSGKLKEEVCLPLGDAKEVFSRVCAGNHRVKQRLGARL